MESTPDAFKSDWMEVPHVQPEYQPTNRALTPAQELTLCQYIERLDGMHMSPRLEMITKAANFLLSKSSSPLNIRPTEVGQNWVFHFLARKPEYYKRKSRPFAVEWKNAEDPAALAAYFDAVQLVWEEHDVLNKNTWNMNKTGFHIECE